MTKTGFGEYLALIRRQKKMTQAQVAELLDVTDKTVSKWERNLSFPTYNHLKLMSKIFAVPLSKFISFQEFSANCENPYEDNPKTYFDDPDRNYRNPRYYNKCLILLILILVMIFFVILFPVRRERIVSIYSKPLFEKYFSDYKMYKIVISKGYSVFTGTSLLDRANGFVLEGYVLSGEEVFPIQITCNYEAPSMDKKVNIIDNISIYSTETGNRIVLYFTEAGDTYTVKTSYIGDNRDDAYEIGIDLVMHLISKCKESDYSN